MKRILIFLLLAAVQTASCSGPEQTPSDTEKKGRTAVVKSRFDRPEGTFREWKIPFTMIEPSALEEEKTYSEYTSIFIPCGIEVPLHEMMKIESKGLLISSVSRNEKAVTIDISKTGKLLEAFVKNGGTAGFSGYSFKYLDAAFPGVMTFFSEMPFIGEEGTIDVELCPDLKAFCRADKVHLSMEHSGWIALKDVSGGSILGTGTFSTPLGNKTGPVSFSVCSGSGEAIFTATHSSARGDYYRYMIYRLTERDILKQTWHRAELWEQTVSASAADRIHNGENFRAYRMPLHHGANTIYINMEVPGFQADVLDKNGRILFSSDTWEKELTFEAEAETEDFCTVKIYPYKGTRYRAFAVISASGRKTIPYITSAAFAAAGLFLAGILLWKILAKLLDFRRNGGRLS